MKAGFWRLLPWVLFGIAHWDKRKAVKCAERALQLHPTASEDVKRYSLVRSLCEAGSVGHVALRAFIDSGGEVVHPVLAHWQARCRF
eukprot:1287992-Alexandrium_andersonii.AAC.1